MYVIPEIRSNKTEIKQNKTGINSLAQVSDKAGAFTIWESNQYQK